MPYALCAGQTPSMALTGIYQTPYPNQAGANLITTITGTVNANIVKGAQLKFVAYGTGSLNGVTIFNKQYDFCTTQGITCPISSSKTAQSFTFTVPPLTTAGGVKTTFRIQLVNADGSSVFCVADSAYML
ncbi:hypothetical protein BC830DRAFT_1148024 [Chytriomyces sp. MP71]|nr:hypothetical protein BC830DRAFT_1148024 [Chytriomyces sp. MP71]